MLEAPTPLFTVPTKDQDNSGIRIIEAVSTAEKVPDIESTEVVLEKLGPSAVEKQQLARTREWFLKNHRWIPYSKAELTLGARGLSRKIEGTLGKVSDRSLPAIETHFRNANSFLAEASREWHSLDEALAIPDSIEPSINQLHTNQDVRDVLINFSLAKHNLAKLKWPPRKPKNKRFTPPNPRETLVQEIAQEVEKLDDDELVGLWQDAREATSQRLRYWKSQIEGVEDNPDMDIVRSIGR